MRRSSDPAVTRADTLRFRWLTVVLVVMTFLTLGWPLIDVAVPNRRSLAAGTMLPLGPGQAELAKFTVGPGWSMMQSESDPRLDYALRRGNVDMIISFVHVISNAQTAELWSALRQVIQVSDPGVSLGPPSAFTTAQGRRGDRGSLTGPDERGTASIVRNNSGTFAVEAIVLGPRRASGANLAAAHLIVLSLHMPGFP
jgi:hypothetical protein